MQMKLAVKGSQQSKVSALAARRDLAERKARQGKANKGAGIFLLGGP